MYMYVNVKYYFDYLTKAQKLQGDEAPDQESEDLNSNLTSNISFWCDPGQVT